VTSSSRIFVTLVFLTLVCSIKTNAQDLEVSVDRAELARGETLTYTIRIYEQRQGMQLDLTPLTEDFDVLGTRTSSQVRSINGQVESWTDYIVTLFPLTEGELTIPPIEINNLQTEPILISVVNEGPRSNQDNDELFLEIEVNKDALYVQEQLLFTVKLYYTINGIRNPQFTELEMEDTVIQLIGSPNQYEQIIEGVRYGVYEKRYVIFPQRSGPLEIPDILFRGEVTDGSSNFVFRNLNTRRVTAFIEGITISVNERPVAAQEFDNWLPVTNLNISEEWSTDLENLSVGDSITRTITLTADGLDGAVLPPFSPETLDGINVYQDPASIERTYVDGSIVGTRVESSTLVPVIAGTIEIPEIVIPWWDVSSDELKEAVITAKSIQVSTIEGETPSEQAEESIGNLEELLAASPTVDQEMIDAQEEEEFIEVGIYWLNYIIAFICIVVLTSIYRLVLRPNNEEISDYLQNLKNKYKSRISPYNNERVAFRQLKTACKKGDLTKIKGALITWCDHYSRENKLNTIEGILQNPNWSSLHSIIINLQNTLYFKDKSAQNVQIFSSKELLKEIKNLRDLKRKQKKITNLAERYSLPPLYRT
tara:strand:- start:180 stop:1964 length:1785 start_codon:yes stop_codon:yes gene_type:complete